MQNDTSAEKIGEPRVIAGSGGLKRVTFSWKVLVAIVILVATVGGYFAFKSFAGKPQNIYSCPSVGGKYPAIELGAKDGATGPNDQCVSAVQWAFKTQAGQKQITVNGTFDEATRAGAINFQKYFRYPAADGKLSSDQMAAIAYFFGAYKPAPPVATWQPTYPGQPRPGNVYWGSSKTGNGDVTKIEQAAGVNLGVHRTFYTSDKVSDAVTMAKTDLAQGRIPMISFHPPGTWKDVGDGKYNAWATDMLVRMDALGGPVWVALNHEPEGGEGVNSPDDPGGPSEHKRMNQQIRKLMNEKGTKNVSLDLILMGYTWSPASGRNPDDWYVADTYDQIGVDVYWKDKLPTAPLATATPLLTARTFAASKGKDIALYEWGLGTQQDINAANKMQGLYNDAIATPTSGQARIVAISYFNSSLNGGTELLAGNPLYETFITVLKASKATHWMAEKPGALLTQ